MKVKQYKNSIEISTPEVQKTAHTLGAGPAALLLQYAHLYKGPYTDLSDVRIAEVFSVNPRTIRNHRKALENIGAILRHTYTDSVGFKYDTIIFGTDAVNKYKNTN